MLRCITSQAFVFRMTYIIPRL